MPNNAPEAGTPKSYQTNIDSSLDDLQCAIVRLEDAFEHLGTTVQPYYNAEANEDERVDINVPKELHSGSPTRVRLQELRDKVVWLEDHVRALARRID